MTPIDGKVVAITGASSGIGEATALLLAARGAKLALGARRLDRLEALAGRIAAAGGKAAFVRTDVKRRDDLAALVNLALERFGKLDVLINNAGIGPISPFDDLRVEEWEDMIDVNIKGVLYGIAAALRCSGISSTPHRPLASSRGPPWRFIPGRNSPCARSRKGCARRPATR
jgi:NADP-dependent 3-hydroxy acid dehydrogenase YdfG